MNEPPDTTATRVQVVAQPGGDEDVTTGSNTLDATTDGEHLLAAKRRQSRRDEPVQQSAIGYAVHVEHGHEQMGGGF